MNFCCTACLGHSSGGGVEQQWDGIVANETEQFLDIVLQDRDFLPRKLQLANSGVCVPT